MIVLELKEATKDKAFELIDEIKELGHKKMIAICELEDVLYKCFESYDDDDDDELMPEYRGRRSYGSRSRYGMRDEHHDMMEGSHRRSSMEYRRRDRMGRFI